MLEIGIKGRCERLVTPEATAKAMGSGSLEVLATPALAAMMEQAAWESVQPYIEPGQTTVGNYLELRHRSPTPLGQRAWAESELTCADGRLLAFAITAYDERGPIATARHDRVIVDAERFLKKSKGLV